MVDTYTRQASFKEGDVILADHGNLEFNQLVRAFNEVSGHTHDGTVAGGASVPLLKDPSGTHTLILTPTGVTGTVIDKDPTLLADSDTLVPSQKAVKAFIAAGNDRLISTTGNSNLIIDDVGITSTHIIDDSNFTDNSSVKLPTQRAVKAALDSKNNLVSGASTIVLDTNGVSGTVIKDDATLSSDSSFYLPTVKATKGYIDAKDAIDIAARQAISTTVETNRLQVATDIASAIAASEGKPHIGYLQDSETSPVSIVNASILGLSLTSPTTTISTTGGDLNLNSDSINDINLTAGNNLNAFATNGSISINSGNGSSSLTATGGDVIITSSDSNVDISSTLGTSSISGAIGTTVNSNSGNTTISATSGNTILSASGNVDITGSSAVIAATGAIEINGASISGTVISNDATMAANSALLIPTQQAAKGYIDNLVATSSAPVNTSSLTIQDSTTTLDKFSLTIDGPNDPNLGGKIILQAGTTDDDTADVWLQKIDNSLSIGQAMTTHTFKPTYTALNGITTVITDTTTSMPGLEWNGATATLGNSTVLTASSSSLDFQNSLHTFTPTAVNLMVGDVSSETILDNTRASFLGGDYVFTPTQANLLNGTTTFTSTALSALSGNLTSSDTSFTLFGSKLNIIKDLSDIILDKEYDSTVGGNNSLYIRNNTIGDIYFSAKKDLVSQNAIIVKASVNGTYSILNFDGNETIKTIAGGASFSGDEFTIGLSGTDYYLTNLNQGNMYLVNDVLGKDVNIKVRNNLGTSQDGIKIIGNSSTVYPELYYDNTIRFNTSIDGIDIHGTGGALSTSFSYNGVTSSWDNVSNSNLIISNTTNSNTIKVNATTSTGATQTGLEIYNGTATGVNLFYNNELRASTNVNGFQVSNNGYKLNLIKTPGNDGLLSNLDSGSLVLRNEVSGSPVTTEIRDNLGTLFTSSKFDYLGHYFYNNGINNIRFESNLINLQDPNGYQSTWWHDGTRLNFINLTAGDFNVDNNVPGKSTLLGVTLTDTTKYSGVLRVVGDTEATVQQYYNDKLVSETTSNGLRVGWNTNGYVDIGPQNTSYCHLSTDRPEFLFNKAIAVSGEVRGDTSNYSISDGSIKLRASRQALQDLSDSYLRVGNDYTNGIYCPYSITSNTSIYAGGTTGTIFAADSNKLTYKNNDIISSTLSYDSSGTSSIIYNNEKITEKLTWAGSYIYNIDPIDSWPIGSKIVIHKGNSTSDITINLTGTGNIALYGPWNSADSQIVLPINTSGSITITKVQATVFMCTLDLVTYN